MTRKSRRELERELEDLTESRGGPFIRQAVAVIDGEREVIDADPPTDDYHTLVAMVGEVTGGSLLDAADAVATVEGIEPEPLADFTDTDSVGVTSR